MVDFTAIEEELEALRKVRVVTRDVELRVKALLERIPDPQGHKDAGVRIRILMIRGRARLLLPKISMETEQDFQRVLKLQPGLVEAWVELSECLLRRNAYKEACEALDSALRIDPNNADTLCKYSQVLRNRSANASVGEEQRRQFLKAALARAKEAVALNADNGDAWHSYSLALLVDAVDGGARVKDVRKAQWAVSQALSKVPGDPDMHFNRGMMNALLGRFGAAAADFLEAFNADPANMKSARGFIESNHGMLLRTSSRMKNYGGLGKKDFTKFCASIPESITLGGQSSDVVKLCTLLPAGAAADAPTGIAADAKKDNRLVGVKVLELLSEPTNQPTVYLAADRSHTFVLLLLYGVRDKALKMGDLVTLPFPPTEMAEVVHTVPAISFLDSNDLTLTVWQLTPDPMLISVNGALLSKAQLSPMSMSSRLFV